MAKISILSIDEDGFLEEEVRYRPHKKKELRQYGCPCCGKEDRLTLSEAELGRVCRDCSGED